jgi:methionine sulfoxide reductase heme-binding subunit
VNAASYSDPSQHAFWLASRSLGVVAILLVSIAVALGLALSARLSARPGSAAWLRTVHEALTLTALGAIAAHGLTLLGDSYLRPGIIGITVPFTLSHLPLWTGLGVAAGWLAAILGLSFYGRRWIGPARWRRLHHWTVLAYLLALAHAIGAGTDARSGWFLFLLGACTVPVAIAGTYRLIGLGQPTRSSPSQTIAPVTRRTAP